MKECGADLLTVHAEACTPSGPDAGDLSGRRACARAVALNPATPLEAIRYVYDRLDMVLLMTVNPGIRGPVLSCRP